LYRCGECKSNPNLKAAWGCENESRMAEPTFVDDDGNKYWNCPVRYIPDSIINFLREYDYYKRFPSALSIGYAAMSPRFKAAMEIYEAEYLANMKELQHGK
jgi:hypothetical protein